MNDLIKLCSFLLTKLKKYCSFLKKDLYLYYNEKKEEDIKPTEKQSENKSLLAENKTE